MNILKDQDQKLIEGGAITSQILNSLGNIAETVFEIGRSFGSTIRRLIGGNICKL